MLFTHLGRVVAILGLALGILLIAGATLSSMNEIWMHLKPRDTDQETTGR
jgi:hypothetical protein